MDKGASFPFQPGKNNGDRRRAENVEKDLLRRSTYGWKQGENHVN